MTNYEFRTKFNEKLNSLSSTEFETSNALNCLDEIDGSYYPLMEQFFIRYYGEKEGAKSFKALKEKGSGVYSAIASFLQNRANYVSPMIEWSDNTLDSLGYDKETFDKINEKYNNKEDDNKEENNTDNTSKPQTSVTPVATPSAVVAPTVTMTPKKTFEVNVTAKKGKKKIVIKISAKAKVNVKLSRKIIKNSKKKVKKLSKDVDGKISIKLSKKLKKGDKLNITVTADGYEDYILSKKIK
jgi:hypothetical protein